MRCNWIGIVLAAGLLVAALGGGAGAGDLERAAFEEQVKAELRELDAGAVELLERAEAARLASDAVTARTLYRELLERVPGFVHAERRLCGTESRLGNQAVALELCRSALATSASPENQLGLAVALISAEGEVTAAALDEAEALVEDAVRRDPSIHGYLAQCQLAAMRERVPRLQRCSEQLRAQAPDEMGSWWFSTIAAAMVGDWGDAREYLERARALGLPDEMYEPLDQAISENQPIWPVVLKVAGVVVAGWLALMLLLIMVGAILSRRTMRAADAISGADAGQPVHPAGASLRATYQRVLQISCAIYYLSIPVLLGVVVLTGGGIIYGFWIAGYIPVQLVLMIGVGTVVTVGAILRSLSVRADDEDPGKRLDCAEHPELRAVLDEVAGKVGTRPVDNVYLTPGTDIAVLERGGVMSQLRGSSERCLILGIAVLDRMSLPAFKAILAHEYGHFSNRDTAGGGLALAVRRSLLTMGVRLAESGSAAWYNPAWLFFHGFFRVFLRISHGASRLQEILADRWAVLSYGARNFEAGLRHAIATSVRFEAHAGRVIDEVVASETPLRNLYQHRPTEPLDDDSIAEQVEAAIDAEPDQYDSHPCPADRFRWAHAMNAAEPAPEPSPRDAASLLGDRDALEELMTHQVRDNVRLNHGMLIP